MKLRTRKNAIRLRLTRGEVSTLAAQGEVRETITFGPRPEDRLTYVLTVNPAARAVGARVDGTTIAVELPPDAARSFGEPERVGVQGTQRTGGGEDLTILIEKDFARLARAPARTRTPSPIARHRRRTSARRGRVGFPAQGRRASAARGRIPMSDARTLRDALNGHRAELVARIEGLHRHAKSAKPGAEDPEGGVAIGRAHAAFVDVLIQRAYAEARGRVSAADAGTYALGAVGSYGRGILALGSDADVRLLVGGRSAAAAAAELAEALLYPLWDAGLAIGHQVMEPDEAVSLAHQDLAAATTLLDFRTLSGDAPLVEAMLSRAWNGLFAESSIGALIDRLDEEVEGRHDRFGGSVYILEPDVKNGAGGLRDLDVIRWAARARYRITTWQELVRLGVLVPREADEIRAAEEFLWRVRHLLHVYAGRKSDRLTFDAQETMSSVLGYAELNAEPAARATGAERLMQDYYVHARAVTRARERMLDRARPPKRRVKPVEVDLGRGVRLFDGQLTIAGTQELHEDPALALRMYTACARQGYKVLPFAREALARAAADPEWATALRASREAASLFVELVCTVAEVKTRRGSMVGELHDVGLLLAMIPEFSPVTGRVHHDVYHVYTVDVHSVAAVDCLAALARGELANAHPLASRLAAEIARPKPIFLATLLHDVGKGYPDASGSRKNHSVSGAELCEVILPRLGLGPEDVAEVRALVLQHLSMYHVATRRDLDDPATAEEFCRKVRGREGLRDLYLLTVADITTTSPTAMTSWKARMLEELYIVASGHLSGHVGQDGFDERRRARGGRVRPGADRARTSTSSCSPCPSAISWRTARSPSRRTRRSPWSARASQSTRPSWSTPRRRTPTSSPSSAWWRTTSRASWRASPP